MLVVNIKSTYKEVSSDSMMSKLDMRLRNTILEDDDEFISTANGGGSLVTKLCLTATPRTITHQAPLEGLTFRPYLPGPGSYWRRAERKSQRLPEFFPLE